MSNTAPICLARRSSLAHRAFHPIPTSNPYNHMIVPPMAILPVATSRSRSASRHAEYLVDMESTIPFFGAMRPCHGRLRLFVKRFFRISTLVCCSNRNRGQFQGHGPLVNCNSGAACPVGIVLVMGAMPIHRRTEAARTRALARHYRRSISRPRSMPSLLHHNPSKPTQLNPTYSNLFLCTPYKMPGPDLHVDSYISYTFTPQVAEIYLAYLFKVDPKRVRAFGVQNWPGAFFVADPPMNHCRPQNIGNGRYAWLLDYAVMRYYGTVVPQQLWSPQGQGDWRRYVEQAQLHIPVFFVNTDGNLGVPVSHAAAGQMSLRDANEPAPLGDRTTTKIRISWPGYTPSEQQVQLRDQTPARNPVTLERFVKHVGSRVRQFLLDCERVPCDPYSKWIVGPNRITFNEVMLIGVVQVSAGSWMPVLQLKDRVVM